MDACYRRDARRDGYNAGIQNHKYSRDGHLFKERFKSEPVSDMAYFTVLLRYIHQNRRTKQEQSPSSLGLCLARRRKTIVNPLKAGVVENVKDYEYSSWGEYDGTVEPIFQICDTQTVLNRILFTDLEAWVNDPLGDDICCLDNDNEKPRLRLSDDQVWQQIIKLAGVHNSSSFQKLNKEIQRESLRQLLDMGASVRQLQRLTGLGRGLIQRL